jgi:type IV secretion system protein VirD4
MRTPPPELPPDGILVGYSLEHERRSAPIGFLFGGGEATEGRGSNGHPGAPPEHLTPILHTGGGHLLTIAPTGAGKGVSCIIPTLLRFPGPVLVIDPKGENAAVTAQRRRALGQEVVILDPMGITGTPTPASLNPLDLIDPQGPQAIDDAAMIASLLGGGLEREDPRNVFWYQKGEQLLTAIIQYVATELDPERRNLSEVAALLNLDADDFGQFVRHHMARANDADVRQVAGTLTNPAQEMVGSIVGMAQNALGFLRGGLVHRATERSSFSLAGITQGDPLSIYLVIPPDKLQSHRGLLRVWVGTLMAALLRRRAPVRHNTLFILDEAAQLGPLEHLRQAITLLRGYGLQTWSFWQDHSQLRNLYPVDWQTMYNNCRVHQAFGFSTVNAAAAISDLTGFHDPLEALRLDPDEMLLSIAGDETVIAQKPDYLSDPAFQGLFAPNPFYHGPDGVHGPRRRPPRRYRRPGRGASAVTDGKGAPPTGVGRADAASGSAGKEEGQLEVPLDGEESSLLGGALRFRPFTLAAIPSPDPRDIPLLHPGGLTPLPGTTMLPVGEVPPLLDRLEAEWGENWNRYRTLVRTLQLPFPGRWRILDLRDPERSPGRDLLLQGERQLRPFHGGVRELDELVAEAGLLPDGEAAVRHALLRLHFTRGTLPRIHPVGSPSEWAYWTGSPPEPDLAELLVPASTRDRGPGVRLVTGTALTGGDLVSFRLPVRPDGSLGRLRWDVVRPGVASSPISVDEVVGDAGLARLHGPWEEVEEPKVTDLRGWLQEGEGGKSERRLPFLRRSLSAYPGMELIRIPPSDSQESATVLLWGGGRPWRPSLETWMAMNARFLAPDGEAAAREAVRVYGWLRADEEYPIVLLETPEDLAALASPQAPIPPETLERLARGWEPMTCELGETEGRERFAFRFRMAEGGVLRSTELELTREGRIESATGGPVATGLPLDRGRMKAARSLPALGDPPAPPSPGAPAFVFQMPAILGDPLLAPLHGPWALVSREEVEEFRIALGPEAPEFPSPASLDLARNAGGLLGGAPAEAAIFRRALPCFPGAHLLRLPSPADTRTFLLWDGGTPEPVLPSNLENLNRRFLSLGDQEAMESYVRFVTWLRAEENYPIALIPRPQELAYLLESGTELDEATLTRIGEGWRLPWVRQGEEGAAAAPGEDGRRIRSGFMILHGPRLLRVELVLTPTGGVEEGWEEVVVEGLPVDPERFVRARALPSLGVLGL